MMTPIEIEKVKSLISRLMENKDEQKGLYELENSTKASLVACWKVENAIEAELRSIFLEWAKENLSWHRESVETVYKKGDSYTWSCDRGCCESESKHTADCYHINWSLRTQSGEVWFTWGEYSTQKDKQFTGSDIIMNNNSTLLNKFIETFSAEG